ncbi:MAG: ABC transporter permease [Ruminococcus sp.]|nr:ABC transporter permease [Ruminococcus sp.]
MKNPLNKRLPRELKSEFGKYFIIFVFFVIIISAVSGFLVADGSLQKAYNDGFTKYNTEHGNLELTNEASDKLISSIEEKGDIVLYKNFYKDEETLDFSSTLRMFSQRDEVNKPSLWEGELPEADNDIAIDRLYAKNHKLEVGSDLAINGVTLNVSGIVALPDYSTLYESPTDLMFDNDSFGVGVMTKAGFDAISDNHIHYCYSWQYNSKPSDDQEEKKVSEQLMNDIQALALEEGNSLQGFIPGYVNQAIIFAGEDMGDDKVMFVVFLYLTVVILSFVMAITTESTILKESSVIGTLRASGYTRGELIRHYLILPMLTLAAGAVVGNVIGYTLLEKFMAGAYLGSYGLPTYEVIINADAFVMTTVIPMIIMFLINLVTLVSKLRISPLRFIRRDIGKKTKKKAFRLNTKIPIMTRFRLRVIFQNIPNYLTIFIGILLADVILFFGLGFAPLLNTFEKNVTDNLLAENITILRTSDEMFKTEDPQMKEMVLSVFETKTAGAEKAATLSLETYDTGYKAENVTIYGIEEGSRYINISHEKGSVTLSTGYGDKYGIKKGDTIKVKEKYGDEIYSFKVGGFYDYPATIAVFMDRGEFCEVFGLDSGYFNIYFSNEEITDIDDLYIMTVIDSDDLTKTPRQLIRSMGNMMVLFKGFGIIIFSLVIFLLAKLIVEKNAQSISMTKILGYKNSEINGIYVHTTTIVTVLSMLICIPLVDRIMALLFKVVFMEYSGYFAYEVPPTVLLKVFGYGIAVYAIVALILDIKVKKVELAEALKNAE